MRKFKILLFSTLILSVVGAGSGLALYYYLAQDLPEIFAVEDYQPTLVSDVFARDGEKIGEFYMDGQARRLLPFDQIPVLLREAFMAAEDSDFYLHNGFNYKGIMRALFANLTSGNHAQGASTISQQTARTLFLSPEKTVTRKLREAIMARRLERNLTKDQILYLYLNQVYFGQSAYGVAYAAETYFRKKVAELTVAEMALLAGLLTAPSRYNPVSRPERAKIRQQYVLKRMLETGRISQDQYDVASNEVLTIYRKKLYKEVAPYFVETIRLLLTKELGAEQVMRRGVKIYSSLDYQAQVEANLAVQNGLRDLDKRQGFRGPKGNMDVQNEAALLAYLSQVRDKKVDENIATFSLYADGTTNNYTEFVVFQKKEANDKTITNIPEYLAVNEIVEGVVTKIDVENNLVVVRFAESQGIIPLENMAWARPRDLDKTYGEWLNIKKVTDALHLGDIIDVQIMAPTATKISRENRKKLQLDLTDYAELSLEQEPEVEGALLSFDLKTEDIIAMVGGSAWEKTKLNRTYQATRQTGSSFKPIVYAAALDKGLTPATPIMGAPIVYNQQSTAEADDGGSEEAAMPTAKESEDEEDTKVWKPGNYEGGFTGDILLRNALKKSLNTPTIRVLEKAGVSFVTDYARRLGVFSPLNNDMSLALGTSGATLYEMTKVFSIFARMGKNIRPVIIHEVKSYEGDQLLQAVSLDLRFTEELKKYKDEFEQKRADFEQSMGAADDDETEMVSPFFHKDPEQLISPQTAYLVTTMLQAAVTETGGTGVRANRLRREVAGKTGTTNGYYDAWFMGYTPQMTTGVWVGFDQEQTLGKGQSGGRAALPIWLYYMEKVLADLPKESFPVPDDIVFANIDNETGQLAGAGSHEVVRQAFRLGNEPGLETEETVNREEEEDKTNLLREDI